MVGDLALAIDPRFPNLRPDVVRGFLTAPETVVAEVIDGELSLTPRPRPRHAIAAVRLSGRRDGKNRGGDDVEGPGTSVILIEPELHLGPAPNIVVPDIAGWRRERFASDALDDEAQGRRYLLLDTHEGDETMRAPPFEDVEIPLATLWRL